ncbi:CFEM-domain-containing protein [Aspergillus udagawae]|uniref:CFEM-domain-containing protein n=1 Tax=Aspergillus udagawae TaxID=91492 RepID=A0A8H3SIJ4_9EURO|nr:CFEM-domain-containing protein [Aspergillus udagawae]GFF61791.1 CFEM-domain-containing protein [Aspergillus udagawae]GFG00046.1 CFEM-domain-containing protein [Aspergillus udagawae]GFG20755.1 CFEM-domain-containing protein [Aspergillus udagawae]
MRLAAAAVVLGAGAITSAQLSNIPQCSLKCLTSALGADGCSELTDFACHCQKTGLVEQVVPCVKQACDVTDQQAVSNVVVSLCSGVGHPVSVPPVYSSAPTSTAAGSVPTKSSSSNSTTVSGLGGSPHTSSAASTTSSTVNTASPSSTSQFNGASGTGSGAAQVAGTAILLASMMFLV